MPPGVVPNARYMPNKYFIDLNAPDIYFQPRHNLPSHLVFLEHGFRPFDGLLACVSILFFSDQWLELTDRCGLSKTNGLQTPQSGHKPSTGAPPPWGLNMRCVLLHVRGDSAGQDLRKSSGK